MHCAKRCTAGGLAEAASVPECDNVEDSRVVKATDPPRPNTLAVPFAHSETPHAFSLTSSLTICRSCTII